VEPNNQPPSNPVMPPAPEPVIPPAIPQVTTATPPPVEKPNGKKKMFIIIGIIMLVLVMLAALLAWVGLKAFKSAQVKVTESTNEQGTQITSYQLDDPTRTDYSNSCYESKIPGSAKVNTPSTESCTIQVIMPDTTLPFIQIASITDMEGMTAKQAVQVAKTQYDDQYKQAGNDKATTKVTEDVGLANLPAHRLDYSDGTFSYVSYFVEIPADKNYMEGGKKIGAFLVNGYNNNVATDVFTKYTMDFISSLRFK
jgi:hypothetical protein